MRTVGKDRTTPEMSRHTVVQAADILGITTGAVRNRLSRGTLRSTKEGRTVYVLLPADMSRDAGRCTADTPSGMPDASEAANDLREQLRREQDAHAEARRIIAGLVQRVPAIDPPAETPSPGSDVAGPPETGREEPGATPRSAAPGPQTGAQRRPWWRRVFGG